MDGLWNPHSSRYLTGSSMLFTTPEQMSATQRSRFFPDQFPPEEPEFPLIGGFHEIPLEVDVGTTGMLQYDPVAKTYELAGRIERYSYGTSYSEYVVLAPSFVTGSAFELKAVEPTPFASFEPGMSMLIHTGTETNQRP